ncbi:MAG: hypothetical protein JXA08_05060 [Methanomicrobiaceae archaeon]|nr:hypothetical protein [Methanomicrobiaceae archaeon]
MTATLKIRDSRLLSESERIELLYKELGISTDELLRKEAREQARQEKEKAAAEARRREIQEEAARLAARERMAAIQANGQAVVFLDGVPVQQLTCPDGGELSPKAVDSLAVRVSAAAARLVSGEPLYIGGLPGTFTACEIPGRVSCTCGRVHTVRCFVSGNPRFTE